MNLRTSLLAPLILIAAACGRQDAAPFVAPDIEEFEKNTGAVELAVLRDTANSRTVPKFVTAGATTATGQTRVNLYRADDSTFRAGTGLTDANGRILITGVAPGEYILKADLRRGSSSLIPAEGIPITVVAGDTVTTDTLRVRIGARIAGTIRTDFLDQTRNNNIRHGGVKVVLLRETATNTNVYIRVDSTETNGVGSYEFLIEPGPERVRIEYSSLNITNFKDSTTLGGNPPVPYVRKVEQTNPISGINPGRDQFSDAVFLYPTRLTGIIYRDRNANGTRDSLPVINPKEGLVAGDTVQLQLRDSTDSRVISTVRVIAAVTTPNNAVNTYTFSPNPAPGKYVLRLDRLASRFPSNPLEFPNGPAYEVRVTYPAPGSPLSAFNAQCRPYIAPNPSTPNNTPFGNCNFGLVTGQ